jgi:hypothetical protein
VRISTTFSHQGLEAAKVFSCHFPDDKDRRKHPFFCNHGFNGYGSVSSASDGYDACGSSKRYGI